jgi:hypothetical protein
MATRYARKVSDDKVEHYDSKEEMEAAAEKEAEGTERIFWGVAGFLIGSIAVYIAIGDIEWPKWLRLISVFASGSVLAALCVRFAKWLSMFVFLIIALIILVIIGSIIWSII